MSRHLPATVCPSQALFYGTRAEIEHLRPRSAPIHRFQFGGQTITTKVHMMAPKTAQAEYIDVTAALDEQVIDKNISLNILMESVY